MLAYIFIWNLKKKWKSPSRPWWPSHPPPYIAFARVTVLRIPTRFLGIRVPTYCVGMAYFWKFGIVDSWWIGEPSPGYRNSENPNFHAKWRRYSQFQVYHSWLNFLSYFLYRIVSSWFVLLLWGCIDHFDSSFQILSVY